MTYSDNYNLRTKNVKFNDVADAIDGSLTRSYGGTTTGVVNQYISSPTPSWTSYEPGQLLVIIPHVTNTGASTVNVNGLGAKSIKRAGVDVVTGDLLIGTPTLLVYSGAYFESLIIQNAINRDGTNSPTANLPMGGFKHTGVGNASANDQYVAYGQIRNGTPFYLDTANNRVGIGTTAPFATLDVVSSFQVGSSGTAANNFHLTANPSGGFAGSLIFWNGNNGSGTERMRLTSSGSLTVTMAASANSIAVTATDATRGIWLVPNLGVGGYNPISTAGDQGIIFSAGSIGTGSFVLAPHSSSAGGLRISSAGNVGFGVSPSAPIDVQCNAGVAVGIQSRGRALDNIGVFLMTNNDQSESARVQWASTYLTIAKSGANPITFNTNGAERARFNGSDGTFSVGTTSTTPATENGIGVIARTEGLLEASRDGNIALRINRKTSDGNVMDVRKDGVTKALVSISGETVTWASFAGSHWSQVQDGSKPEILKGTVIETIDQMCQWPDEGQEKVLPKTKVSDTIASTKVYGVFDRWDYEWEATNDMNVVSLGAFMCRIAADKVVQIGDLLESNGDGTARPQSDSIVKSSTIGKVISTNKAYEYSDGSYCVPTVLYCG